MKVSFAEVCTGADPRQLYTSAAWRDIEGHPVFKRLDGTEREWKSPQKNWQTDAHLLKKIVQLILEYGQNTVIFVHFCWRIAVRIPMGLTVTRVWPCTILLLAYFWNKFDSEWSGLHILHNGRGSPFENLELFLCSGIHPRAWRARRALGTSGWNLDVDQ